MQTSPSKYHPATSKFFSPSTSPPPIPPRARRRNISSPNSSVDGDHNSDIVQVFSMYGLPESTTFGQEKAAFHGFTTNSSSASTSSNPLKGQQGRPSVFVTEEVLSLKDRGGSERDLRSPVGRNGENGAIALSDYRAYSCASPAEGRQRVASHGKYAQSLVNSSPGERRQPFNYERHQSSQSYPSSGTTSPDAPPQIRQLSSYHSALSSPSPTTTRELHSPPIPDVEQSPKVQRPKTLSRYNSMARSIPEDDVLPREEEIQRYPPTNQNDDSESEQGVTDLSRTGSISSSRQYHTFSRYDPDGDTTEGDMEGQAIDLVDEGKSKLIDGDRLARWGGCESLTIKLRNERLGQFDGGVIQDLSGATHVMLSNIQPYGAVLALLVELVPVISSTLVVLDIHSNGLKTLPEALTMCHSLEEVNISSNPICSLPEWLGELTNLRVFVADETGLKTMPVEMMNAQLLHTICLRRNRLISLPPWLSQLPRLGTLLINDNPFAGPWKTLSQAIVFAKPGEPSSSRIESDSVAQASARSSTMTSPNPYESSGRDSPASSIFSSSGDPRQLMKPTSSSSGSSFQGYAHSSTEGSEQMRGQPDIKDRSAGPTLRRMRSAGTMLGLTSIDSKATLNPNTFHSMSRQRTVSANRSSGNISSDEEEMETLTPPSATTPEDEPRSSSTKNGKWGFLKKMSMSKMRSGPTVKTRPPLPHHTESESLPRGGAGARPAMHGGAHTAMTLPTRGVLRDRDRIGEFGQPLVAEPVEMDERALPSRTSVSNQRGKRRSFLPILDAPPSLNVTIPSFSSSPFTLSSLSITALKDSRPNSPFETPTSTSAHIIATPRPVSAELTQAQQSQNYEMGFRSLMSYLSDLYDLALPVPTVHGGAEVITNEVSMTATSISGTSDPKSGASSPHIGSSSAPKRSKWSGIDIGNVSRSESPVGYAPESRPSSIAKEVEDEVLAVKRYKDDPVVRSGVVKHIVDTERTYVRGLQDLVDIYVKPSMEPISKNDAETVIPANERKIVFGGIEGILQFHKSSFLPALEKAAGPLYKKAYDTDGSLSQRVATDIAEVFKRFHPFMRQYSAYINNFDYALLRLKGWSTYDKAGSALNGIAGSALVDAGAAISAGAMTAGLGIAAAALPAGGSRFGNTVGSSLSTAQKKRIKTFLKRCRKHPRHTQLNVESYMLLPVQRIPRYRMLLEDLARSTPPSEGPYGDSIEDALQEVVALASSMNEEKRDSESRRKLVKWQQRIRGRFSTPLVQAHRRLLLDGNLTVIRNVKRSSALVEIPNTMLLDINNTDQTITNAKSIVQVETLAPETMIHPVVVLLTTDMMLLCKDPSNGTDPEGIVNLFAVLKLQTKRKPASLMQGNGIRLVDNRNILYLTARNNQEALNWVRVINNEFEATH